ncbi:MAG: ATP-dependent Clp protease proteolytic subunit [Planctomycetaceae bacterium]|nr:ATP-dependent Clp protease proteolytic subunit [Planctomycetaceae bacterium]
MTKLPIPRRGRSRDEDRKPRSGYRSYPNPPWAGPPYEGPRNGWEIVIAGELADKPGDLHEHLLHLPRNSSGTIFFDSCGGSAYIGLALASLIRLRGLQAVGVVAGECSSAALMPLAACAERYVTPHATLLFHPIRWQSEEQVRLEEAAEWARHFQLMEVDHDLLLANLFGCDVERIKSWCRPGRFVSGQELVEAGLAKMVDLFSGDVWKQREKLRVNG